MNASPKMSAHASDDWGLAELVDELTARLQAGEPVDLEAVARAHPAYALACQSSPIRVELDYEPAG